MNAPLHQASQALLFGVTHFPHVHGPHISWAGLSPIIVLAVGALVVLLVGLMRSRMVRERVVPVLTLIALLGALGVEIWRFGHPETIIHGALRVDDMGLLIDMICAVSGAAAVFLSWRARAPREAGHGEFHSLLLFSVMGMVIYAGCEDAITLLLGIEMLSIPLYILCASEYRRAGSLESGLKYLIIGSVGSAMIVYGLAMVYGATGQTGFEQIAHAITGKGLLNDPLLLVGMALVGAGLAYKASVAPFHQWTPDVYEGAPTPITAFMATATKAAALAAFIRFFDVAVLPDHANWGPLLGALAATTILVGNVAALGQSSLKRLLGFSGVAQAGYMLATIAVGTKAGISATVLYLGFYLAMNIAAFAVIHALERETGSDQVRGLAGFGKRRPALAWSMTIAMLALAGIPGTVGFVGKFQLIRALVDGGYSWLAIILVIGAMISLGYYLRVVAAVWMGPPGERPAISSGPMARVLAAATGGRAAASSGRTAASSGAGSLPPIAGGSPEADILSGASAGGGSASLPPIAGGAPETDPGDVEHYVPQWEVVFIASLFAALCIIFGLFPSVTFHLASHAGAGIQALLF